MSVKIEITFRNANAAHKAAIMMETLACPLATLDCRFCPYKDACAPLMALIKALKEV